MIRDGGGDPTSEVDRLSLVIGQLLDLRAAWDAEHSRATMGQFEFYPRQAGYYGALLDALADLVGDRAVP